MRVERRPRGSRPARSRPWLAEASGTTTRLRGRLLPGTGGQAAPIGESRSTTSSPSRHRRTTGHAASVPAPLEGRVARPAEPGLDAGGGGQARAAVGVEQVDEAERQVGGGGAELRRRRRPARPRPMRAAATRGREVAQRRHAPLADHPLGGLGDDAQHAARCGRRRRRAGCRRTCGRSPRGSRCARGRAAGPRPRWRRRCRAPSGSAGSMSSQISAHTSRTGRPSAQGCLACRVSRR